MLLRLRQMSPTGVLSQEDVLVSGEGTEVGGTPDGQRL